MFISRNNRTQLHFDGKLAQRNPSRGVGSSGVVAAACLPANRPSAGAGCAEGEVPVQAWGSGRAAAEGQRYKTRLPCLLIAVSAALLASFMIP